MQDAIAIFAANIEAMPQAMRFAISTIATPLIVVQIGFMIFK